MAGTSTSKKHVDEYTSDASSSTSKKPVDASFSSSDANLSNEFEASSSGNSKEPDDYLCKIQRGGFIQPFGCLLAVEEGSFRIVAHSKNAMHFLAVNANTLLGCDAKTLFSDASSQRLTMAATARVISVVNPVMVFTESRKRPFHAILHKVDIGIVIDLEPVLISDPSIANRLAVEAQNRVFCAISDMQANPRGNISALCDTVAKSVEDLTKYDRVMVYKFHEDDHGEVVSEVKRPDLEPYLGFHYPATDIPQAARFLFKQIRVRMICDVGAAPVPIVQNYNLDQPLVLVNSTLRAPHGCHAQYMINMNSIGSLVMPILLVNENNKTKLWGLVSCHQAGLRYLPYQLRSACELLIQAFGSQLNLELQWLAHMGEKKNFKTQALLCNMVLKDDVFGIVSRSPNMMDLVQCEGAALYYNGVRMVLLGVTPSELQIKELTEWLFATQEDVLSVWKTESLLEVGYPYASTLNNAICGVAVAVARINSSKDALLLLWFRCATGKEIKWGGHPGSVLNDDGGQMHPRSSFKAYLEVVKNKSFLWETWEISAIRSLREVMYNSFNKVEQDAAGTVGVKEMVRMFETAIVPIFAVNAFGLINKWNSRISVLTGVQASEAVGNSAFEVIHNDSKPAFRYHLCNSFQGHDDSNIELRLNNLRQEGQNASIFIVANACSFKDNAENVVSVWFVAKDFTEEKLTRAKPARVETDDKPLTQLAPMFLSDKNVRCSEWNAAMAKLTGWDRIDVVGKLLPGEIFGGLCRLKSQDGVVKLMIHFCEALCNSDREKEPFGFFNRGGMYTEGILSVNKMVDLNGEVVGCSCVLEPMSVPSSSRQAIE